MHDSSNFDETWPKKEQTQDFKHQLPSRLMFIKRNKICRHLEYSYRKDPLHNKELVRFSFIFLNIFRTQPVKSHPISAFKDIQHEVLKQETPYSKTLN